MPGRQEWPGAHQSHARPSPDQSQHQPASTLPPTLLLTSCVTSSPPHMAASLVKTILRTSAPSSVSLLPVCLYLACKLPHPTQSLLPPPHHQPPHSRHHHIYKLSQLSIILSDSDTQRLIFYIFSLIIEGA